MWLNIYETPTTYPIWTPQHEEYIRSLGSVFGISESEVAKARLELESLNPDRVEDFHNYLGQIDFTIKEDES